MERGLIIKDTNKQGRKIRVLDIKIVKIVNKPWGWERWIADGTPNFPYALKEIFMKAPYKSSVQFHKDKQETNYIQKGNGILHYSHEPINIYKFIEGGYTQKEINRFIKNLRQERLVPGKVFHIYPGFIHRVEALKDLLMIESSSVELDDVFRLQDDTGRKHGKIKKEH